ncbi:MAG: MBL fold metallo-hydrolase [Paludibacteraceae bacterium]|nr:MBL fold metallo-hydrolase [Paludibacteraceae bacterium]
MKIQQIPSRFMDENTYVVSFADNNAVIIDCGAFFPNEKDAVRDYIEANHLHPIAHLLTHGHFDHCFGARYIFDHYGLKPVLATQDDFLFRGQAVQMKKLIGIDPPEEPFTDFQPLAVFDLSPLHCQAIPTPGHTPGGVCYLFEDEGVQVLFSGDTLFRGSIGRTDHDGGDFATLITGIREQLMTLPESLPVYPGHGQATTIGFEKKYNPFL